MSRHRAKMHVTSLVAVTLLQHIVGVRAKVNQPTNEKTFELFRDGPNGPTLCAGTPGDEAMTSAGKSLLECSLRCQQESNCTSFNYRQQLQQQQAVCQRWFNGRTSSCFTTVVGCKHFRVQSVADADRVEQGDVTLNPVPLHTLPNTTISYASGVTSLGDELFVARLSSTYLDVYDAHTFAPTRQIQLPGSVDAGSRLAASNVSKCVYMTWYYTPVLFQVNGTSGISSVATWSTCIHAWGVSVTSDDTVYVVCVFRPSILEYTLSGSVVREIYLQQPGIITPVRMAVQLSSYRIGVVHYGGYCVVCMSGAVIWCISGTSDGSAFNNPIGLASDGLGRVYIADYSNSRIVVVDTATHAAVAMAIPGGVKWISGIYYDRARDRLYVGDYPGRVLVLGN